jgi:hypothetical protein
MKKTLLQFITLLSVLFFGGVSFLNAQTVGQQYTIGYPTQDRYDYTNFCRVITGPIYQTLGNQVSVLQGALRYQIMPSLSQTGYHGPVTRRAVQIFQRQYGIYTSGYVGPQTYARMRALWCGGVINQINPIPPVINQPICTSGYVLINGRCGIQVPVQNIAAPSVSISISPTTFVSGQTVSLNWSSQNATTCTLNNSQVQTSGSQSIVIGSNLTSYTISCSGQGGTSIQTLSTNYTGSSTGVVPSVTVYTTTPNITSGQTATINLVSTNISSCTVSGGIYNGNSVSANGNISVSPTTNTTYTFTCLGANGQTVTAQVIVNVNSVSTTIPAISSFTASPNSITTSGQSVYLSWNSSNANSCTLTPSTGSAQTLATSGTLYVYPTTTTTYNLTCTNSYGASAASTQTITIGGNGTSNYNLLDSSNFWLACTNATSQTCQTRYSKAVTLSSQTSLAVKYDVPTNHCSAVKLNIYVDGSLYKTTDYLGWYSTSAYPNNGIYSNSPLTTGILDLGLFNAGSHTVSLEVVGAQGGCNLGYVESWGGSLSIYSGNANSNVNTPTISSFTASPNSITTSGQSVYLSWNSSNANSCTLTPSTGSAQTLATSGTLYVYPTTTTTYNLTCTNSYGTSAASTQTVTVGGTSTTIPVINSFVANPSAISSGQVSVLSWLTANTNSCTINGGSYSNLNVNTNGYVSVNPTTTTTYTLSCVGYNSQNATSQLTLNINNSIVYNVVPSTPTFSPIAGTYTSAQTVTLNSTNSTSIRYTTDGTIPSCTTGLTYSAPIAVNSTQTVKAIGCNSVGGSTVANALYTINFPTASTPTFSPIAGTYTSAQTVTLNSTNSTSIRYTTDGTIPSCTTGLTYSAPIAVNSTQTVKAIGCNSVGGSTVANALYTITVPAIVVATPVAGTYNIEKVVNLVSDGSTFIRYTKDGTIPSCTTGLTYSAPIAVNSTQTIKAIGCNSIGGSTVGVFLYTLNLTLPSNPVASPAAGTYTGVQNITLTSTRSTSIRYTTTGTTPTCTAGSIYSTPIAVNSTQTIKAIGCNSVGGSNVTDLPFIIQ